MRSILLGILLAVAAAAPAAEDASDDPRVSWLRDLEAHVRSVDSALWETADARRVREAVERLVGGPSGFSRKRRDTAVAAIAGLRDSLHSAADRGTATARARAWWDRVLGNLATLVRIRRLEGPGRPGRIAAGSTRDARMADNLIWLAEERYPERKIVVWTHNLHLIRNPSRLQGTGGRSPYAMSMTMGGRLAEHFGDECYALGFTAHGGAFGLPWYREGMDIEPAPAGSFEDLCRRAGLVNAIVDLCDPGPGGDWLDEPFVAQPLFYRPMRGPWRRVLDGLFFQRTKRPGFCRDWK